MSAAARFAGKAEWLAGGGALAFAAMLARSAGTELPASAAATLALGAVIGLVATWIAWQDLRSFTISDAAVLALAALGVASRWSAAAQFAEPPSGVLVALALDVVFCGGLLFLFREGYYRLRGFDGLGFGDVKLGAAGAVLVGTAGFAAALFAASATGLAFAAARRWFAPGRVAPERIAFGAALAPAFWIVWLVEATTTLLPPPGGIG